MFRLQFSIFILILGFNLFAFNQNDTLHHSAIVLYDTIKIEKTIYETIAISDTVFEYEEEKIEKNPDTIITKKPKIKPNPVYIKPGKWSVLVNSGIIFWLGNPPVKTLNNSDEIQYGNNYSYNPEISLSYQIDKKSSASVGLSCWKISYKLEYPSLYETKTREYYSYFQNTRQIIDSIGRDSSGHTISKIRTIYFKDSIPKSTTDTIKGRDKLSSLNSYYIFEFPFSFSFSVLQNRSLRISLDAGCSFAFLVQSKGKVVGNDIYVYKTINSTSVSIPYIRLISGLNVMYKIYKQFSFSLKGSISYTIPFSQKTLSVPDFLFAFSPGIFYTF